MKYFKLLSFLSLAVVLLAFNAQYTGAIQGKFLPSEGIQEIRVISGPDTIKVTHNNGSFPAKKPPAKDLYLNR